MNIISLMPAATEILAALGVLNDLVGRSHECDFPKDVSTLPICSTTAYDCEGDSATIDAQVTKLLDANKSLYTLDIPLIKKLQPDLIVIQDQCAVCAIDVDALEKGLCQWDGFTGDIVSLVIDDMATFYYSVQTVANAIGKPTLGNQLIEQYKTKMAKIGDDVASFSKPTVATIEWIDPVMCGGNWMPELVTLAGGVNLFGTAGNHSPWIDFDQIAARDPDVMVIMPCGYDMSKTRLALKTLISNKKWDSLKCVNQNRVYITDGNQYFNRSGPRLVDSVEILAEICHEDYGQNSYEGIGWERL